MASSKFRFSVFPSLTSLLSGIAVIATALSFAHAGEVEAPVSFVNDVMPVLTKAGCNAGVCHAKAGGGQKGFHLSLLGFETAEDYEHIVKENRGRRLFPAAPENSLLLTKASGKTPHGGGLRLPTDSPGYATLLSWIRQGAPYDGDNGRKACQHRSSASTGYGSAKRRTTSKGHREVF